MKGGKENGCVDGNGREYDFVSRYFAPWNGINEDPVTGEQTPYTNTYLTLLRGLVRCVIDFNLEFLGAAHTVLAPYWSKQLGKSQMYGKLACVL